MKPITMTAADKTLIGACGGLSALKRHSQLFLGFVPPKCRRRGSCARRRAYFTTHYGKRKAAFSFFNFQEALVPELVTRAPYFTPQH